MTKRAIEIAVFIFILMQISSLTSFTNKDGNPHAQAIKASTVASVQLFLDNQREIKSGNRYAIAENLGDKSDPFLKQMAKQEAKRIIDTGDVSDLQSALGEAGISLDQMDINF